MHVTASSLPQRRAAQKGIGSSCFSTLHPCPSLRVCARLTRSTFPILSILFLYEVLFSIHQITPLTYPGLNMTSVLFDIGNPTESCRKVGKGPRIQKGRKWAVCSLVHEALTQGSAASKGTLHFLETLLERNVFPPHVRL